MVIRILITTTILLTLGIVHLHAQSSPSTFDFVENKGQWEKLIRFKGQLPAGEFYLHNNGFTVAQHNADDLTRFYQTMHGGRRKTPGNARSAPSSIIVHSHAYRLNFAGSAANPQIVPDRVIPGYTNYIIGNDRSKWSSEVKTYQAVVYKNIYPNIDVRYYSENDRLKYDLVVHPGGRVTDIVLRYEGADKLLIKNKELVIKTSVGDVHELYPYTYQFDNAHGKQEVACSYELADKNTVRFKVADYSSAATLIIDPSLIFSSFTNSRANQFGFTATPGPDGSLYSGGIVFSAGFPTNTGAYQTEYNAGAPGVVDIGILKFSSDGKARVYATYLGGSSDDLPHSLFCDPQGNLVIMGRTYSTDYPGDLRGKGGQCDIVVTKLNATGSLPIGSLRIGGDGDDGVNITDQFAQNSMGAVSLLRNYGDDSRSEVILDATGNIYVAAQTQSDSFPMVGGGFQDTLAGLQDGVVMKIDPNCTDLIWSTYLGGKEDDAAFVLAINPATQDVYVAGGTASNDFPGDHTGVLQPANAGVIDGYIAVISNDGTTLIRSTYLGTDNVDLIYGIQFDRNNYPYVMGTTRGNWTPFNAAYQVANSKQFIGKLRRDLSGYEYTTCFGTSSATPNMSPVAFMVDRCENVYISGWGGFMIPNSVDPYSLAGIVGMPITPDAIQSTTDDRDMYFIVIERNANSLLYGTYYGANGGDGEHVDGGTSRFDQSGVIYQAICASCYDNRYSPVTTYFPTSPDVWGPRNGAGLNGCNLAALKIGFNYAGVAAGVKAFANGVIDTVGCIPFTITFRDTVRNAKFYEWSYGDGSKDDTVTASEVSHTYMATGTYLLRLIAVDSATCNIRDTSFVTIRVRDDMANLSMNVTKLPPCESLNFLFENTSTFPAGKPFNSSSFTWDFGDGTRIKPGPQSIQHSYAAAGTYKVKLILIDTNYCNSPDSVVQDLSVSPLVEARFETPLSGCVPHTAVFNNTSLAGEDFSWNFGDGGTSTELNPTHVYTSPGTWHVTLIVVDSNTCNISDTAETDIVVHDLPVADFSVSPLPSLNNTPSTFTNLSSGGVRYLWQFGDGDTTLRTTTDTVVHQYNMTGTYNTCLVVWNEFGCTDTICAPVQALVTPLLDVPNAFTPGRFGRNGIVSVASFGITKMRWRIYNRWGQVVFESHDRKVGWDGTFKGQLQPMDVYAYTLEAEFFDGTKARKTGDITLIR